MRVIVALGVRFVKCRTVRGFLPEGLNLMSQSLDLGVEERMGKHPRFSASVLTPRVNNTSWLGLKLWRILSRLPSRRMRRTVSVTVAGNGRAMCIRYRYNIPMPKRCELSRR
jgi:hypothetical protein